MTEVLVPFVHSLIIHDAEGDRLFAKYYDGRNKEQQKDLEGALQKKTKNMAAKNESEILLLDNELIVFKSGSDCKFYVTGSSEENELVLLSVMEAVYESVSVLMRGQVDKRTMLDNLELILLTIDEALDNGHIMELDSSAIVNRVLMKGQSEYGGAASGSGSGGVSASSGGSGSAAQAQQQSLGDLSLSQALGLARDQFFRSWTGRGEY